MKTIFLASALVVVFAFAGNATPVQKDAKAKTEVAAGSKSTKKHHKAKKAKGKAKKATPDAKKAK